ncbi:hypothetical protein DCW30_17635 [Streptomyces alfalfae]|uniref:DNA-binding phage zinc finger domain-containing protein n=1 Tax=Streptomyces alfalfae TaxID=1642299 RepID=A0A1P8TQU9_9ACTN|nr:MULTISPECIES: hypothetical protein [Streptomyces]AYA20452.1 hypothetical protein D3X13_33120 [Streptomyces fradiae]APY89993.1 hypothetical protein A7J05_33810 [Streptomyces alfalfae]KUL64064.1 hypothetical protein ADL30_01000 [Streptomyces sp. NRRL S-1521]QQC87508.1 hypothetical protein I8755_03115 [Streptomyces alfalfae]QUI29936.1 hypothetical protein H9W91_03000 [Streptomyces alfalfae]
MRITSRPSGLLDRGGLGPAVKRDGGPAVLGSIRAADAAHDAAHAMHARFRHGVYSVACTTCHAPAGSLCFARRTVHTARRELYRQGRRATGLVPALTA